MPTRDHSRTTQNRSQFATQYKGDPGEVQIERRNTKNFNKPGYGECPSCNNWAFIKPSGELRAHLTGGLANVTCPYTGVPKGFRFIERVHYEITLTYTADVILPEDFYKDVSPVDPQAIRKAHQQAVIAAIPEVLEIPTDGTELNLKITAVTHEAQTIEETK